MKRIAYLVLVVLISLLAACSSKTSKGEAAASAQASQEVTETPSMNIEEIAEGNYNSVAGIWVSASGERLVFNAQGVVTTGYSPEPASLTYQEQGNFFYRLQ